MTTQTVRREYLDFEALFSAIEAVMELCSYGRTPCTYVDAELFLDKALQLLDGPGRPQDHVDLRLALVDVCDLPQSMVYWVLTPNAGPEWERWKDVVCEYLDITHLPSGEGWNEVVPDNEVGQDQAVEAMLALLEGVNYDDGRTVRPFEASDVLKFFRHRTTLMRDFATDELTKVTLRLRYAITASRFAEAAAILYVGSAYKEPLDRRRNRRLVLSFMGDYDRPDGQEPFARRLPRLATA